MYQGEGTGDRETDAALGAPGPLEHLQGGCDVQALPPAALGRGLPGQALCDNQLRAQPWP